jgi:hypothetical protein
MAAQKQDAPQGQNCVDQTSRIAGRMQSQFEVGDEGYESDIWQGRCEKRMYLVSGKLHKEPSK